MTERLVSQVRSGCYLPHLQRELTGALCTLLLLFGTSWPTSAGDTKPITAILLVARAELPDSNFAGSVVLVMNNLGSAPVGIIINRPTQIAVSILFPDLEHLAQLHDKVYFGGPVEFGSVWFLVRAAKPPEHAIQVFDGIYLSANRELLVRLLGRDKPMDGLRIFVGHSGWAPGQLEAEIARGEWSLKRADADAIFNGKSEHLWPAPQSPKRST
jgi:putative transcriptional regulator